MYFKWKAYDFNVKYFEGIMECDRFEEVVIELAKQQLVAKEIQPIEYDEYKKIQAREKIIKRMENIKARIYNKPSNSINPKLKINIPKIPQSIITITFLIFLLGLLILLAYIASHQ